MWLAIKVIGFTILIPGVVTLLIPSVLAKGHLFFLISTAQGWHLAGWFLVSNGILLYILSAAVFAIRGRGTPAPVDPPKQLIVGGVYSFTRNPMYLAVLSLVLGLSVLLGLWPLLGYAIFLFLFFHVVVVFYEEPTLRRQFGGTYEEYCKKVPRWWFRLKGNRHQGMCLNF